MAEYDSIKVFLRSGCYPSATVQRIKCVLSEEKQLLIGAWVSALLQSDWKESIFARAKLEKGITSPQNAAG